MASYFEAAMLICFGLSWPVNIAKSLRSKTAKGKSIFFEILVITGYILGVIGKIISGNINWVLAIYFLDIFMVAVDLNITFKNRKRDKIADMQQKK